MDEEENPLVEIVHELMNDAFQHGQVHQSLLDVQAEWTDAQATTQATYAKFMALITPDNEKEIN